MSCLAGPTACSFCSPWSRNSKGGNMKLPGVERAARVGLTDAEYARIVELVGREPGDLELDLFGVMWSEHCSYKTSRPLLCLFPTTGAAVLQGPGENAGIVDIGDGLAVVMKVESHNPVSYTHLTLPTN